MREIKFRAWHKHPANGWVMSDVLNIEFSSNSINTKDGSFPLQKNDSIIKLMQYTGLTDKGGDEIYEADIIESDSGIRYVVEWVDQLGGFYLSIPNTHRGKEILSCAASQHSGDPIVLWQHKIVGNKFENPELFNQGEGPQRSVATKDK